MSLFDVNILHCGLDVGVTGEFLDDRKRLPTIVDQRRYESVTQPMQGAFLETRLFPSPPKTGGPGVLVDPSEEGVSAWVVEQNALTGLLGPWRQGNGTTLVPLTRYDSHLLTADVLPLQANCFATANSDVDQLLMMDRAGWVCLVDHLEIRGLEVTDFCFGDEQI